MRQGRDTGGWLASVCVCTFRRAHLQYTLDSLGAQIVPDRVNVEIIIVDNDVSGSGRATADRFAQTCPFPVRYAIEPVQNIALARNRGLDMARGSWIAMIDDDEIADPRWLHHHVETAKSLEADVLMGPVLSRFETQPPAWLERSRLFERPMGPTGSRARIARTGNAFLRAAPVRAMGLRFDPAYGLTGGEDNDFFERLGRPVLNNRAAIVTETQPPERMTLAYHKARARVFGTVHVHRAVMRGGTWPIIVLALKSFSFMACAWVLAGLLYPVDLGRSRYWQVVTVKWQARLVYLARRRLVPFYTAASDTTPGHNTAGVPPSRSAKMPSEAIAGAPGLPIADQRSTVP